MANNPWPGGGQGFPCPQCGHPFRLTAAELLAGEQFNCTSCGLVLTLAKEQSRPALEQLRAYEQKIEQITATVPSQSGTTKPK
ncbi:MAG TPA: hypothetical protein VK337_18805 [Xanthobacteraceae bacterium]|nr:hypothetical protein [Xanthobacteraceae bacterium]